MFPTYNRLQGDVPLKRYKHTRSDSIQDNDPASSDKNPYLFFAQDTQFKDLGLNESAIAMIRRDKKTTPSKIQALAIPPLIARQNVRIGAETGSGKTLAYLLPLLHHIAESERKRAEKAQGMKSKTGKDEKETENQEQRVKAKDKDKKDKEEEEEKDPEMIAEEKRAKKRALLDKVNRPQAVIFVPHNELCSQVGSVLGSLLHSTKLTYKCLTQKDELLSEQVEERPHVLVTTLYNFLNNVEKRRGLLFSVKHVVVDEADMLLSGAFQFHMRQLLEKLKKGDAEDHNDLLDDWIPRQYVFAAATLPNLGKSSAINFLRSTFPEMLNVSTDMLHHPIPNLRQDWYSYQREEDRNKQLLGLLKTMNVTRTLIFVNSVHSADNLQTLLAKHEIKTRCFHKDVPAKIRELSLDKFREGTIPILICTDLAARGIDFNNVSHVIQLEFAASAIDHIHRIGRTARAGALGTASNFYTMRDEGLVRAIKESSTGDLAPTFKQVTRRKLKRQQKSQPEAGRQDNEEEEEEKGSYRAKEKKAFTRQEGRQEGGRKESFSKKYNPEGGRKEKRYNSENDKRYLAKSMQQGSYGGKEKEGSKERRPFTRQEGKRDEQGGRKEKRYNSENDPRYLAKSMQQGSYGGKKKEGSKEKRPFTRQEGWEGNREERQKRDSKNKQPNREEKKVDKERS